MTLEEMLRKDKTNDGLWAWSADKGIYKQEKIPDSIFTKYRERDLNQEPSVNTDGLSSDENG